ncbi:hypothetical protein C9374_013863 [Naegleria lovaniensis]|uniref:Uncharacterized protein n=1 Tax=Naegleria lovaniensis TaxID=51637 RepID=A0AA88KPD1_NAELO|nr:uncharacterized protein C9374_013863 [Naegleria lovaniensis]KAG2389303.1 hypothetical protein C9374_013863 [Naegleria lovaniensis]
MLLAAAITILLFSTTATTTTASNLPFKNIQGPPSEFSLHQYPEPSVGAMQSDYHLMAHKFTKSLEATAEGDLYEFNGKVAVDSSAEVDISVLALQVSDMDITIYDQYGNDITSKALDVVVERSFGAFSNNERNLLPSKTFRFDANAITAIRKQQSLMLTQDVIVDEWTVSVKFQETSTRKLNNINKLTGEPVSAHLHILTYNQSPLRAYSQLQSYDNQHVGDSVVVEAFMFDHDKTPLDSVAAKPSPLKFNINKGEEIRSAKLQAISPSGQFITIDMSDHGDLDAAGDKVASDGIYSAKLSVQEPGDYTVSVVVQGVITSTSLTNKVNLMADVIEFERTTHHVVSIVKKSLELTQGASLTFPISSEITDTEMMTVKLIAKPLDAEADGKQFKAYAEVYASSSSSSLEPVAFISGMTIAEKCDGSDCPQGMIALPLQMSVKWIAKAQQKSNNNLQMPFILKNVNVQDVASSNIISKIEQTIPELTFSHISHGSDRVYNVKVDAVNNLLSIHPIIKAFDGVITETMLFGPRPVELAKVNAKSSTHKVILIHGYCSGNNPFPTSDFNNAVVFEDLHANRNNDKFAKMIAEVGSEFDSFSMIGHSQGGMASLHLVAFYWSKADVENSKERRVIQSVGTPYRGSGLAGCVAGIGNVVGIGCGSQSDLTYDGASKWLSSIPLAARQKVWYSYTVYKPYSWCSLPANAVLKWPNDGTCEKARATVEGANLQDTKTAWCHTADMKYKCQCLDTERNALMNKFAQ